MRKWIMAALLAIVVTPLAFFLASEPARADSLCSFTSNSADDRSVSPGIFQLYCDSNGYLDVDVKAGGSGGGGSLTLPYGASSGQTSSTASFIGNALWNGTTVDAWRDGPAGSGLSNGTAGVPFMQGTLANGYLGVVVENSPLPTATTGPGYTNQAAQPVIAQPPNGTNFAAQVQNSAGTNSLAVDANGVTNAKVCDATTSTQCAAVDTNGRSFARISGASGTSQANVEAPGDGAAQQNSLTVIPYDQKFNGSTWDRAAYCTSTYTTGTSPITSPGTTTVISASGSTKIHVCDWQVQTVSGTSPQFYFDAGTGGSCGTSTVYETAQITGAALQVFTNPPNSTNFNFVAPSGDGLCLVVAGSATPTFAVTLHYAQY